MSVASKLANRQSEDATAANKINSIVLVTDKLCSLPDTVDTDSIAGEFRIGIHSDKQGFTNHVKVGVCESLDPSSSLAEIEDKTIVKKDTSGEARSREILAIDSVL